MWFTSEDILERWDDRQERTGRSLEKARLLWMGLDPPGAEFPLGTGKGDKGFCSMQPTEPSLWQAAPSDINHLFTQRVYRQALLERPVGRFWMRHLKGLCHWVLGRGAKPKPILSSSGRIQYEGKLGKHLFENQSFAITVIVQKLLPMKYWLRVSSCSFKAMEIKNGSYLFCMSCIKELSHGKLIYYNTGRTAKKKRNNLSPAMHGVTVTNSHICVWWCDLTEDIVATVRMMNKARDKQNVTAN